MITSQQNQYIKNARKLQQRRHRHQQQQFFVEGVRIIGDALQGGINPKMLFYVPELVEKSEAAQILLGQLAQHGVEQFACSEAIFATLTETVTPQGIGAIFDLPQLVTPTRPTLTVVLDNIREPGNAGTLLRSAEAAGVEQVIFAPGTVDPFNSKVVRSAMGSHFRLPIQTSTTWIEVQSHLNSEQTLYLAQADGKLAYDQVNWRQPAVLIISGETAPASPQAQQLSTKVAIPMHGSVESLNAAMAGTVILFEIVRQRRVTR